LEDLGVDLRIILKRILTGMYECGLDSSGSGYGPVLGSFVQDNEAAN